MFLGFSVSFCVFNADPDPSFYLNADPDPGSQPNEIYADPYQDPDPGQSLPSQKVEFLYENDTVYHMYVKKVIKYTKAFRKALKPGFF